MTLQTIKHKLETKGYSVKLVNNYIDSKREKISALIVDTDYIGPYPPAEVHAAHAEIKKLVKDDFKVESRGFYTAIYIF